MLYLQFPITYFAQSTFKYLLLCNCIFSEPTLCDRVSLEDYEKQKDEFTSKTIVDLVNYIIDDTRCSLKEKKLRLKQVQKSHPMLYDKHFSDIVW